MDGPHRVSHLGANGTGGSGTGVDAGRAAPSGQAEAVRTDRDRGGPRPDMLRILLVGDYPDDPRLGSAKVPHKLQEEFRSLGHSCDALYAGDVGHTGLNVHLRTAIAPTFAARAIRAAVQRKGPYDIIDVASAEGFVVGLQRRLGVYPGTAIISRSNGLEHLNYQRMLEDHDEGLRAKPWPRRLWFPAVRMSQVAGAARLADRFIVLNEGDYGFAVKRGWKRPEDIDLIPHGVSSHLLENPPAPSAPRGRGILFCASWNEIKGTHYLAAAFSELVAEGCRTNLTVLGGGVPEETIRAAFSADAQPFLTILPRVAEREAMAEFARHDLLVMCSTYEGFAMVVLEAMAQRLPVVATPVGCATTLVRDNETGIRVPARSAAGLAAGIRRMLASPSARVAMAERAYLEVRDMTWTRTARATVESYERALSTKRRT